MGAHVWGSAGQWRRQLRGELGSRASGCAGDDSSDAGGGGSHDGWFRSSGVSGPKDGETSCCWVCGHRSVFRFFWVCVNVIRSTSAFGPTNKIFSNDPHNGG